MIEILPTCVSVTLSSDAISALSADDKYFFCSNCFSSSNIWRPVNVVRAFFFFCGTLLTSFPSSLESDDNLCFSAARPPRSESRKRKRLSSNTEYLRIIPRLTRPRYLDRIFTGPLYNFTLYFSSIFTSILPLPHPQPSVKTNFQVRQPLVFDVLPYGNVEKTRWPYYHQR